MDEPNQQDADWEAPGGSAFVGARWHAVGRVADQAVRLLISIVIARLLQPSEIGVMAVALSVVQILEGIKDLGTGRALIQVPNLTRRMYNSVFTLNVMLGLGISSLLALGAGVVASLYGATGDLPAILRILALNFLLTASIQAQNGVLARRLAFSVISMSTLMGSLVNGSVAITLAWDGWGVWALALGQLAGGTAMVLMVWIINPWRPRLRMHREDLRAISGFSLNLSAANMLTFILGGVDVLLISRFLGTTALGYYDIGRRFVMPARTVAQVVSGVVAPALSRIQQEDAALRRDFLRAGAGLAFVVAPMLVGVAAIAHPLVRVVIGEKWLPAVPVIRIYAAAALVFLLLMHPTTIYFVRQRTDSLMRWTALLNLSLVAAWFVGVRFDVEGVACANLVVYLLLFPFGAATPLRLIELRVSQYLEAIRPFLVAAVLMGAGAILLQRILFLFGVSQLIVLITTVVVSMGVYAFIMLALRPVALNDLMRLLGLRWSVTG